MRSGPLALRHVAPPPGREPSPPQVAYAIGRKVGPAVVRNRIRRRLRHLVAEAARHGHIPQGLSLFIVQPDAADLSQAALGAHVRTLLASLGSSGADRRA